MIVKSENGNTFGGYTNLKWKNKEYVSGEGKSFLFSFDKNTKHHCIKKEFEIAGSINNSLIFGYGFDIYISDLCNENSDSYSNLGHSYSCGDMIFESI